MDEQGSNPSSSTSGNAPLALPSGSSSSLPTSSSGWDSRALVLIQGAATGSTTIGVVYFAVTCWREAWRALLDQDRVLPILFLTLMVSAVAIPQAHSRLLDSVKALSPFRKGDKS